MKIKINNKEVEAYRLIMRKENALDILSGKKKIEIRTYSDHYCEMFFDKEKLKNANKILDKTGNTENDNGDNILEDAIKNLNYVYFTNYNKTWSLVVRLDWIYILGMIKDDIEFLKNEFNFNEYNDEWQQFEKFFNNGEHDKIPMFFALAIKDVISHKGLE